LRCALESRIVIEQAKGVLMERLDLPAEVAFELLRAAARRSRAKIHALAAEVVATSVMPAALQHAVRDLLGRIQQRQMEPPRLERERVAAVAATFREANERIELAAHNAVLTGPIPFICECADPTCTAIVRLTFEQYEHVRAHPLRFFTLPGHETLGVDAGAAEIVVAAAHVVVELTGAAATIAARDYDPA
jgi:hypothetical protein